MDPGDESLLAFASFDCLRGLYDTDGRPLGERKAPRAVRDQVETNLVACDYGDARAATAFPMNVSALLQIRAHWRTVLDRVRVIRATLLARTGRSNPVALDLWRIAHAAASVVSFCRLERGTAEPIPAADAALFKASVGIKYALRHAEIARYGGRDALGMFPSTASLWNYIDREQLLIGDGQVCAGPGMMIRELLDVLVGGCGSHACDLAGLDTSKLIAYADLLAVWETAQLLARAREREFAGERRLSELCRRMLADVCDAAGVAQIQEAADVRLAVEAGLQQLFGRVDAEAGGVKGLFFAVPMTSETRYPSEGLS
jgi:hypothetical protein